MEARRHVEVTGVLVGGAELADNAELDSAHRGQVWGQHERTVRAEGGWLARGGHWCARRWHGWR
jgi:hypothetical protein